MVQPKEVRWGLGDVVIGFLAGELLSILAYLMLQSIGGYATSGPYGMGHAFGQVAGHVAIGDAPAYQPFMPLWVVLIAQIPLWACMVGVPVIATRTKGHGPVRDIGLRIRAIDVPVGLAIGVAAQLVLVPIVYWPLMRLLGNPDVSAAARDTTDRATDPLNIIMVFLIVSVAAPVAEEIFFRGLTQHAAVRRWGPWVALFGTAAFFAFTHFEPLQFPALFLFGLILGAMVFVTGRLGTSMCAHVGFNLVAAATLVWKIELPLWALVVAGLAGLVAGGYLVQTYRSKRSGRSKRSARSAADPVVAENPSRVTAP